MRAARPSRSKYIGVRLHLIRGLIRAGDVSNRYTGTETKHANVIMKPFGERSAWCSAQHFDELF